MQGLSVDWGVVSCMAGEVSKGSECHGQESGLHPEGNGRLWRLLAGKCCSQAGVLEKILGGHGQRLGGGEGLKASRPEADMMVNRGGDAGLD